MFFWSAIALAHVPHDKVTALVVPEAGPWWLVATPGRTSLLLRSEDEGESWAIVGGAPTADLLDDGVGHAGEVVFVGERIWWGDADGWQVADLPGDVDQVVSDGEALLVAGPGGAWKGQPAGPWTRLWGAPIRDLGPTGFVTEAGHVHLATAGWGAVEGPTARAGAFAGDEAWVGDQLGLVWRHAGGTWSACAPLPVEGGIARLALGDGALWAFTDFEGPFRSEDDCGSWIDVRAPLVVEYGGDGGAESTREAFPAFYARDGETWIGGWAGLYHEHGAWTELPVLPPEYTRGLVISSEFATDGRIWWGSYAGGIARTDDAGASWEAPNLGSLDPNIQALAMERGGDRLYALAGHRLRVSDDAGRSWRELETGFSYDESIIVFQEEGHLWVTGRDEPTPVRESWDGGESWTPVVGLAESIPSAEARAVGRIDHLTCISTSDETLACAPDGEERWTPRFTGTGPLSDPVGWPADAPRRLLVTDDAGVHYSEDGETWLTVVVDPEDPPALLAGAWDGSLFLLSRSGRLWRSADGGEQWGPTGVRVPASTFVLSARPDFVAHDELLLGTADGLYRILEATGAPRLERFAPWARVESSGSDFGWCPDCGSAEARGDAGNGDILPVDGAAWETWLRGSELRILGSTRGKADFVVEVDGEVVAEVRDAWGTAVGELWSGEIGDEGWHRVRIEADGLLLDAVEAEGELIPMDHAGPPCGCAGAPGAGWGAVLALVGLRRRRARG